MRDEDYILVPAAAQQWVGKRHLDPVREAPTLKPVQALPVGKPAAGVRSKRTNTGHRKFNLKVIAEYTAAHPSLSQTEVAAHFGCAQTTVSTARQAHGMSRGRGVFLRVPWKKYGRQPKLPHPTAVKISELEPKSGTKAIATGDLTAPRRYERERAQIGATVAIAKAALTARHRGPFCTWASKDEREFCSNAAEHTDLGPRCRRHAGLLGFGICSHDPTKYWDEVFPREQWKGKLYDENSYGYWSAGENSKFPYPQKRDTGDLT